MSNSNKNSQSPNRNRARQYPASDHQRGIADGRHAAAEHRKALAEKKTDKPHHVREQELTGRADDMYYAGLKVGYDAEMRETEVELEEVEQP